MTLVQGQRVRPPDANGLFAIYHTNVDGGGKMPGEWRSLHTAIDQAESWQCEADTRPDGNLWLYEYVIYDDWHNERYRTRLDPVRLKQAQIREAWSLRVEGTIRNTYTKCDPYLLPRLYHINRLRLRSLPPPPPIGTGGTIVVDVVQPALRCMLDVYARGEQLWTVAVRSIEELQRGGVV